MAIYLSDYARADLRDIRYYTRNRFGRDQEGLYLEGLWRHLHHLEEFPRSGRGHGHGSSLRLSSYREHRILYLEVEDGIRVKGVVHGARDLDRVISARV